MTNKVEIPEIDENAKAVRAEGITFHYPDGTAALKGLSFEISQGEKVAIIGPNGSGKSTLLTLFNGVRQGGGKLEILGLPVAKKNLIRIKTLVGLVFQNPDDQLFCPTIFEDVAFGPLNMGWSSEEVKRSVHSALQDVGLEGFEQRSSFHLSFGERKLASIATVLSMQPRIIAMDEPTSNLDLAHRRKIIRWIQNSPRTILLTTHDLDMALETCSRVIILNKGLLVSDGPATEIFRNRELLETNDLELPLRIQPALLNI
ncbi:MAG: ABC transporter ATP-binding protein [Calditrichia bacterium]